MQKVLLAVYLSIPLFAYAQSQRINFTEYRAGVERLNLACQSKGSPSFTGFCVSKKYEEPTQRSLTVGLQIASFTDYYKKCEHSDFPNVQEILNRASKIEDASIFFEEIKPQKEAREHYSNYFDVCKTKDENNAEVTKKLRWFEYMADKYSSNGKRTDTLDNKLSLTLKLVSAQRPERVVDCILVEYKSNEFLATGLRNVEGGIIVQLLAPVMKSLAVVSESSNGSSIEFLNAKSANNAGIPQPDTFDNAMHKCL